LRPKSKVSQLGIARDLGLSQGLVSRILNGDRDHIAQETYDRVWQRALALGYRGRGLNVQAKAAANGVAQIGLILRAGMQLTTHSNYFSHVQGGLQGALASKRIRLVLLGTEDTIDFSHTQGVPSRIVIFGDPRPAFARQLGKIADRIVAVSADNRGVCHTVSANETESLSLLVAHLVSLGHTRIGWIGGEPTYSRHRSRFEAFREALHAHGLMFPADAHVVIAPTGARQAEGRLAIKQLLPRRGARSQPTAVIAYNGTMARGAANALLQEGWKLPADLSIAAVDLTRVCTEDEPSITGASAPPEKIGEEAARILLLDQAPFAHENLLHIEVASKLQVGSSTGKPSGLH
jgi:LacI family transcriptional regulator